jgi:hypothetical protein
MNLPGKMNELNFMRHIALSAIEFLYLHRI